MRRLRDDPGRPGLPDPVAPPCHTTTPGDAPAVRWMSPFDAGDRKELRAWCDAVGPIARYDPEPADTPAPSSMLVVSWNMAVGEGRLPDLIDSVRRRETSGDSAVVLLIQEAYRRGDVPASCPATNGVGGRLGSTRDDNRDIIALARALRLHAVYVPSMRNSRNCVEPPAEDRGNAILSTLPIDDVLAIELPFAQQRRVGIAASVGGIRFVTAHFDTWRGHKDQARALARRVIPSSFPASSAARSRNAVSS